MRIMQKGHKGEVIASHQKINTCANRALWKLI